jgi:SET domain-containing protein
VRVSDEVTNVVLLPCLGSTKWIFDGRTDDNGRRFGHGENPGAILNHSKSPNCVPRRYGAGVWVVALTDVCAGVELTFNYGDKGMAFYES